MVIIFSQSFNPRYKFVFDWIFDQWGIKYTTTNSRDEYVSSDLPKIFYSKENFESNQGAYVFDCGLLFEDSISPRPVRVVHVDDVPEILFSDSDLPFDLFSAIFFMLTRYEEYLPYSADRHGRFPVSASVTFQKRFLDIPVVDIWLESFKKRLQAKYPALVFAPARFQAYLTYDVDIAYKYEGRGILRQLLSASRDIASFNWRNLSNRLAVLAGTRRDPWDVYARLIHEGKHAALKNIFFIQCGTRGEFDKNLSPDGGRMKDLIRKLTATTTVGLHPSYRTTEQPWRIAQELKTLMKATGAEIKRSRQHFLRFKFPDTFRELAAAGIEQDYSLGYPDMPGFRAGTSKPFYFFDLRQNKQTSLQFFPICWMDSTFLNYLHMGHGAALDVAGDLMEKVRRVGGIFIPVFHNFVLAENGWMGTHQRIIELISKEHINA